MFLCFTRIFGNFFVFVISNSLLGIFMPDFPPYNKEGFGLGFAPMRHYRNKKRRERRLARHIRASFFAPTEVIMSEFHVTKPNLALLIKLYPE